MKIKAKNAAVVSMKLCVPCDGVIDIDANGVADVSSACANALVNGTNDWAYIGKGAKVEEPEAEEPEAEEPEDLELSDKEVFAQGLKDMKVEDMKVICSEAGYPEKEWKKLNSKKILSAYLLKKFDEAVAVVDEDEEED